MDTIDSHYAVVISELIFPGYNNIKFIGGHMVCVLDRNKQLESYQYRYTCTIWYIQCL